MVSVVWIHIFRAELLPTHVLPNLPGFGVSGAEDGRLKLTGMVSQHRVSHGLKHSDECDGIQKVNPKFFSGAKQIIAVIGWLLNFDVVILPGVFHVCFFSFCLKLPQENRIVLNPMVDAEPVPLKGGMRCGQFRDKTLQVFHGVSSY